MKKLILIAACLVMAFTTIQASAKTGIFWAEIGQDGSVVGGGDGSGWIYYPQHDWWNQWWYDDPFIWTGKDVWLTFDYQATAPGGWAEVLINWSNEFWIGEPDPPGPYDEQYIERLEPPDYVYETGSFDSGMFPLPVLYNPEWVSVDIRGENMLITNGVIEHICIPEPGSMALIGFGLLVLMRKK